MKLNEFIGGIRTFFNFNRSPHLEISSPQFTYNYQPPSNIIFLCQHHVEKVNPNSKTFDPLLLSKSFSQDLETINIPLEILFVYQVLLKTVKPFLKEGSQDECMELKDTLIQTSINNLFLGEREKLIELLSQKNLLHIASLLLNKYDNSSGEDSFTATELLSIVSLIARCIYDDDEFNAKLDTLNFSSVETLSYSEQFVMDLLFDKEKSQ